MARSPHSLMLVSLDTDTILVPSGEKATEFTQSLWAIVCSATSASVDASASRKCAHSTRQKDAKPQIPPSHPQRERERRKR
eukprot:5604218-Prymnesium_polylepis.1